MPLDLHLHIEGADPVVRMLENIGVAAADMRPAWDRLEERFSGYEEDWFAGEGNGTWPELSHRYAEWKAKHYPGAGILVAEGDLKGSLLDVEISNKDEHSFEFGTEDPKARYHQDGGGNLPQRKVIDVSDDELDEWTELIMDHLLDRER